MRSEFRRARQLVSSVGEDSSSAAQLAAMVAPPHGREEIDAMRATERQSSGLASNSEAADDPAEDAPGSRALGQAGSRWVGEGGALTDGPAQQQ